MKNEWDDEKETEESKKQACEIKTIQRAAEYDYEHWRETGELKRKDF